MRPTKQLSQRAINFVSALTGSLLSSYTNLPTWPLNLIRRGPSSWSSHVFCAVPLLAGTGVAFTGTNARSASVCFF